MHAKTKYRLSALGLLFVTAPSFATVAQSIPEPSVLSLIIAGGIVGAIVATRKRRR